MRRFLGILFILACLATDALAQWGAPGMEVGLARGFLLPHRQSMKHLPGYAAHFVEWRLFRKTDHSKAWHNLYVEPEVGLTVRVFELGNRDLLGYGIGTAAYFSAPIVYKPRFQWNLEIGAGPGFVTKPFDPVNNYKNNAIGSVGNAFIMVGQRFSYKLGPQSYAALAMSFNHFSNAAFSLPNLGLNYPALTMTFGHTFKEPESRIVSDSIEAPKQQGKWCLNLNLGVKEYPRPYKAKGTAWTLATERSLGINKKSSMSIGADVFYNAALFAYRNADGHAVSPEENLQLGIRAGYILHIQEFQIYLKLGAYVLDEYKMDGLIYNRVGIRYFMHEHFGINISLKTHLFKADYFETGIAYRF